MSTFVAIYKCRLCEKIEEAHHTGKTLATHYLQNAILGQVLNPTHPHMIEPHQCDNGSIGIADFQGFKKVGD